MTRLPGEVFARRLHEERGRAGVSQAALADHLSRALGRDVAASAVSRIESGERAVRLDEAVLIADRIGVPLPDLLRDRDAVDEELAQRRADLAMAEWRLSKARDEVAQALEETRAIERRIADLEASRLP